jgi:HD superfamily phosphohydrolase
MSISASESSVKDDDPEVEHWLLELEKLYGEKRHKAFEQEKPFLKEYLMKLKLEINLRQYSLCIMRSPINVGGTGVIFKATHRNIPNKELVIKFNRPLPLEQLQVIGDKAVSMVETERHILPTLNHPNIIQAVDSGSFDIAVGEDSRPLSFIIEPFIPDTVTLRKFVELISHKDKERVTVTMIDKSLQCLVSLLHQWVDALVHTHDCGYVYLDLKPDNTLVDKHEHLTVIDFGSAQKMDEKDESSIEIFVTRYYADPRLRERILDKTSSNRVRCGVKHKDLIRDLDYYALGKSILELLDIISKTHIHDFPQRPLFRSLHFLGTRLLNGMNEDKISKGSYVGESILIETFGGLSPSDYENIHYTDLKEVRIDLEKEYGSWNPEDMVPELGTYSKNVVRVVPEINTVLTPRLRRLLEHPLVARLKMISQLGLVTLVYPTADHSRYDHVLGAYTYTTSYVKSLFHDSQNPIFRNLVDEQYIKAVLLAALFHDLGQFPLAHDLGEVEPKIFGHSNISMDLISYGTLDDQGKTLANIIEGEDGWGVNLDCLRRILGAHSAQPQLGDLTTRDFKADMLSALIDGPIDADKADYIVRDSLQCRIPYGMQLDIERLLRVLTAIRIPDHFRAKHKVTVGVYEKGRASADSFGLARYLLYSSVYWHHTSRILKAMLQYATTMLLPSEVFAASGDDKIKEIRANLLHFMMELVPPFNMTFERKETTKAFTEKERTILAKPRSNVMEDLAASTGAHKETKQQEYWYPGICWTDWLMLNWLKTLSANTKGAALIDMIQRRKLYKRVLTIQRDEHNTELMETLDSLSWPDKIKLSENIQNDIQEVIEKRSPNVETRSLCSVDEVERLFSDNLAILVDVPNLKRIIAERPLIYMPELERKTYYHQSVPPTEAQSLIKSQKTLMESISPVRLLCHPNLRQWLHVCLSASDIMTVVESKLEAI